MNATIERFGFPATLIADYAHWVVLLRPSQPTLGSLILAAKSDATEFSGLKSAAYSELGQVSRDIEVALRKCIDHAKLNYLMLMMIDPHVHFHVIPRYEGARRFAKREFVDAGWPKLPSLGDAVDLSPADIHAIAAWMRAGWP